MPGFPRKCIMFPSPNNIMDFMAFSICHFSPICPCPKLFSSVGCKASQFQWVKYSYCNSANIGGTFVCHNALLENTPQSLRGTLLPPGIYWWFSPPVGFCPLDEGITNISIVVESPVRGISRLLLELQVKDVNRADCPVWLHLLKSYENLSRNSFRNDHSHHLMSSALSID